MINVQTEKYIINLLEVREEGGNDFMFGLNIYDYHSLQLETDIILNDGDSKMLLKLQYDVLDEYHSETKKRT